MSEEAWERRVPLDLAAVVLLAVVSAALLLGPEPGPPVSNPLAGDPAAAAHRLLTVVVGLVFLLFLPGYAVVTALFPGHERQVETVDDEGEPMAPRYRFRSKRGIDVVERVSLAIAVSAVVTPATALAVNFTPWGIRARPLVAATTGVIVVASLVAAVRRLQLPPEERFAPGHRPDPSPVLSSPDGAGLTHVVLAVGVLVAAVGIGYAVAVPKPGDQFTELYLLSENRNGTLVADDYPDFDTGERTPLVVGIENHEGESVTYSLVVELQRVETSSDGARVAAEAELARETVTVPAGETRRVPLELRPTMTGDDLRLRVLLFRGSVASDPNAAAAYRTVDLWINASAGTTPATVGNDTG